MEAGSRIYCYRLGPVMWIQCGISTGKQNDHAQHKDNLEKNGMNPWSHELSPGGGGIYKSNNLVFNQYFKYSNVAKWLYTCILKMIICLYAVFKSIWSHYQTVVDFFQFKILFPIDLDVSIMSVGHLDYSKIYLHYIFSDGSTWATIVFWMTEACLKLNISKNGRPRDHWHQIQIAKILTHRNTAWVLRLWSLRLWPLPNKQN
jgi:hypothetical protein